MDEYIAQAAISIVLCASRKDIGAMLAVVERERLYTGE
jgi:hypothetical protein